MKKFFYFLIVLVFFGCETEEQKKQKAEDVVQALISNIKIDNYESIYEYYPSFRDWTGKYYVYNSVIPTSTMLKDDGTVEIFATGDLSNQLYFQLKKVEGNYQIERSKGLSDYFNSNIYKYCKKIGCIGNDESDLGIGRICKDNEDDFNNLVSKIKTDIENNTRLESHSIKTVGYGVFYATGNITLKNYSKFTIPGDSYKINVNYFDSADNILSTSDVSLGSYDAIQFDQSKTINVMHSISSKFRKVDISLKILDKEFIEDIICEYAEGSSCIYSDNL